MSDITSESLLSTTDKIVRSRVRPEASTARAVLAMTLIVFGMGSLALLQYTMPPDFDSRWGVNQRGVTHFASVLFRSTPAVWNLPTFTLTFRLILLLAWAGYALLLTCAMSPGTSPGTESKAGVLLAGRVRHVVVGIVIGMPLLMAVFCPPALSVDVYGYVAYARLPLLYGRNPYTTLPFFLKQVGDPTGAYLAWNHSTPYGPLWTLLSCTLVAGFRFAGLWGQVVSLKLVEAGALIVAAFTGRRIVALSQPGSADLTFLAIGLNPLLLLEGPGNGHNDLLMVAFLLVGIRFLLEKQSARGMFLIGCSIGVKMVTAALLPWMLWQQNSIKREHGTGKARVQSLIWMLPCVLCLLPFWQGKATLIGAGMQQRALAGVDPASLARSLAVSHWLQRHGVGKSLIPVVVSLCRQWPLLGLYAALSLWSMGKKRVESWLSAWALLTVAPFFLLTGLWLPWYFCWGWPVALLRWNRGHLIMIGLFFGTVLLSVLMYTGL